MSLKYQPSYQVECLLAGRGPGKVWLAAEETEALRAKYRYRCRAVERESNK